MRKYLLLVVFLACKFSVFASHIVGGEFELLHIADFQYRLNMILYFDELNGSSGALDQIVNANLYRKSDDTFIRTVSLILDNQTPVEYSNPSCDPDNEELKTARIFYTAIVTLDEATFSDPEGYYVSWERCCRNYTITNILSDDPNNTTGISAGQTFYLEFPPVTRNGEPFINSTPRLFPPLSDFACINRLYFTDFGGVDDDGDSLVYSLVTPYSTFDTRNAFPATPNPGPYPDVIWQDGFDIDNVINGEPDLAISRDGLLTVTPRVAGLFVFAVMVEEYRGDVKHGEMRRDFQLKVIADCAANGNPTIYAREKDSNEFYTEGTRLNFSLDDDEKCIDILVTDDITGVGADTESQVAVRAIPINFDADLEGIDIDFTSNVTIRNQLDTARFTVCFPDCPYTRSGLYKIGIVGYDNACPQPALDTVIVSLSVPPPPNTNAYFRIGDQVKSGKTTLNAGQFDTEAILTWEVGAFDNEGDMVDFNITPLGFDPANIGLNISNITQLGGSSKAILTWITDCLDDDLDFSEGYDIHGTTGITKGFDLLFEAEDNDQCEWENPQRLTVSLIINFPNQTRPIVYESNNPGKDYLQFDYQLNETISHDIRAVDADNDLIVLTGQGLNFSLAEYDVNFESASGIGSVTSRLLWELACDFDLAKQNAFSLEFVVEDVDACQLANRDTLTIDYLINPPPSNTPVITIASNNALRISNDSIGFYQGDLLDLTIRGLDTDNDELTLTLLNPEQYPGLQFADGTGTGSVAANLTWQPDCSIFTDDLYTEQFILEFTLADNNCYAPKGDTLALTVGIIDIDSEGDGFLPPNVFTPNGDDFNPYFAMVSPDPVTGEPMDILPLDNCSGVFEEIVIYNRWGKEMFSSNSRDFRWYAKDAPTGIYYYYLKFSNREYRGSISVLF